jgi:glycerophosphoryl diester phosphodiesterase
MTLSILIHALVFLAFWLTNLPFQNTLNDFLIGATGWRMNFLLLFMLFAGLVALWSAARLVWRWNIRRTGPVWLYLAISVFFLIFFYASFIFLFLKNPAQLDRLGQLFQYFRLLVDAGLLLFLAWGLRRWVKAGSRKKKMLISAALLILWLIPIFYPPGNVYRGALPEKPRLMAHRGAATLAPENTLAAMRTAAARGVYGLETDIAASADGVLFLMHDATLARTTDVAKVFPGRESKLVDSFTWDELSRLNAGSWFDGGAAFPNEPIPTLEAMLPMLKENNLDFIYDLRIPPAGHPYARQTLALCLEQIKAAGVADHTWILAKPDEIAPIRAILPDSILAAGIGYNDDPQPPASLVAAGYRVVNSVYNLPDDRIRAYQAAGLWVNLWVVDEPWLYAHLWLVGVNSATSNYVQTLASMSYPFAAIAYPVYLAIWGVVGLLGAWLYFSNRP